MAVQLQRRCSGGRKRKSDHQTPSAPKLPCTASSKPTPNPLNLSSDLHYFAFMSSNAQAGGGFLAVHRYAQYLWYQLLSTMIVGSITPAPAGSFSQSKQQQRLQCCLRQRILCTALSRGTVGKCRQDSGPIHWVCDDFPRQKHANRQTKPTFPSRNNMFGRLDRYDRLSYFLKSSRPRILGCKVAGKSALNRASVPSLAWTSY